MRQCLTSLLKALTATADQSRRTLDQEANWRRDPLSHPAIQQMSERERADVPFDPDSFEAE
ncbi:hypothetical protein R2A130_2557 [Ahrensia sp. R2A130]|nr:hypothetical protein R2A130_2557 [Ahrensia sp. R2A130]